MAINSLTFDDINTQDYGIYISGTGAYNAPARVYEMVSIPGRNGQLAIDQGYYNNVDVTYPAFVYDYNEYSFSERMALVRGLLLSKAGYHKLYDTYNPSEYRMGIFKEGIEVEPQHYNKTGEFNLVFNCKPQRYLVSGEVPVTVTSGDSIVNPTLFESKPLLEVEGYGEININDETVSIVDSPMGTLEYTNVATNTSGSALTAPLLNVTYYAGDVVTGPRYHERLRLNLTNAIVGTISVETQSVSSGTVYFTYSTSNTNIFITVPTSGNEASGRFHADVYRTNTKTFVGTVTYSYYDDDENVVETTDTITVVWSIAYTSGGFTFNRTISFANDTAYTVVYDYKLLNSAYIYSTYSTLGNPLYLDLESGQAWKYENDEYVSVNNAVWLGTDMPTLAPGTNTITYDNTIHDLVVTPRWWTI